MLANAIEMKLGSVYLVFKLMIKQITSKGMGNYVIFEEIIDLPILTLR